MRDAVQTNLSYFKIRKIIGILGVSLPVLAPLITGHQEPSISHYYYTKAGVLFTSVLILCGVFLISYKGFKKGKELISDNLITWIGGILIILVAIIPTKFNCCLSKSPPTPIYTCDDFYSNIHFGCATAFFICMGYLCIFNFTKKEEFTRAKPGKKLRNVIYLTCGIGMWITLLSVAIMKYAYSEYLGENFIFYVEVILLVLFGIAWLIKGKTLADLRLQKNDPILSKSDAKQLLDNLATILNSAENGKELVRQFIIDARLQNSEKNQIDS